MKLTIEITLGTSDGGDFISPLTDIAHKIPTESYLKNRKVYDIDGDECGSFNIEGA